MVLNEEHARMKRLLSEAIVTLCKNGLTYSSEFSLEGLLGITLDRDNIILISIKEFIQTGLSESESSDDNVSPPPKRSSTQDIDENRRGSYRHRKSRRKRRRAQQDGHSIMTSVVRKEEKQVQREEPIEIFSIDDDDELEVKNEPFSDSENRNSTHYYQHEDSHQDGGPGSLSNAATGAYLAQQLNMLQNSENFAWNSNANDVQASSKRALEGSTSADVAAFDGTLESSEVVRAMPNWFREYHCNYPVCSFTSNRAYNLKRHFRNHVVDLKFRCSQCNNAYVDGYILRKHELYAHGIAAAADVSNPMQGSLTTHQHSAFRMIADGGGNSKADVNVTGLANDDIVPSSCNVEVENQLICSSPTKMETTNSGDQGGNSSAYDTGSVVRGSSVTRDKIIGVKYAQKDLKIHGCLNRTDPQLSPSTSADDTVLCRATALHNIENSSLDSVASLPGGC